MFSLAGTWRVEHHCGCLVCVFLSISHYCSTPLMACDKICGDTNRGSNFTYPLLPRNNLGHRFSTTSSSPLFKVKVLSSQTCRFVRESGMFCQMWLGTVYKGTEKQTNCNLQVPEDYGQKSIQKIQDALYPMS